MLAGAVFWLHGALDLRRPNELTSPPLLGMLSLLLALYLLLRAVGFWIGRYELLLAQYGAVFGAGYTAAARHAAAAVGARGGVARRRGARREPTCTAATGAGRSRRSSSCSPPASPRRSSPTSFNACACAPTSSGSSGRISSTTSP